MRERILSITIDDCEVQTFRAGGKGGQNQNKRDTGVRVVHRASGAVGESREHRTQLENKRAAFRRMADSPKIRFWIHERVHGQKFPPELIGRMTSHPEEFRVETRQSGRWSELA